MNKSLSIDQAIASILIEETTTVGNLQVGTPITGKIADPNKTFNKVKIPPLLRGSKYDSVINQQVRKPKGKNKKCNLVCDEDEEVLLPDEDIEDIIFSQLTGLTSETTGLALRDLLGYFRTTPGMYDKGQIMRILQRLINKNQIKVDEITKKLFICNAEEDSEEDFLSPEDIGDDAILTAAIIEYFTNTTSGSVGGIPYRDVLNHFFDSAERPKQEIAAAIKTLFKAGVLKAGVGDGTLVYNSHEPYETETTDWKDSVVKEDPQEEEESALVPIPPAVGHNTNIEQPLTSNETADTLKAKGWIEETPGTFIAPDGIQKFIITQEDTKTLLNKFIMYKDNSFDKLCEEFSEDFDNMDSEYGSDNSYDDTEGLDEFDTTEEIEIDGAEDVTITLTADECDLLEKILQKARGEDVGAEDDMIDDLATDEEANIDLMGDDSDEDEDEDEEFDFNFEEDEEAIADEGNSGVYDGSGRNGAPRLTKETPSFGELRRKAIEGAYKPSSKTAQDASGREGAPRLTKETPSFDKSGRPIKSTVTSGAGSKKSIFDL